MSFHKAMPCSPTRISEVSRGDLSLLADTLKVREAPFDLRRNSLPTNYVAVSEPNVDDDERSAIEQLPCGISAPALMDVHEHIHRAVENYFEPDEFRRSLNNAIQDSRNVTFLIQKQKANLPDFDDFYNTWLESIRQNPIMKWAVDARNQITKASDLEKESLMEVTVFSTKSILGRKSFQMSPRTTTEECLAMMLRTSPPIPNGMGAALRIERKWLVSGLNAQEVTSALVEVYRNLMNIVSKAHKSLGNGACNLPNQSRSCVTAGLNHGIDCFEVRSELLSKTISLETGEEIKFVKQALARDGADIDMEELAQRYGLDPNQKPSTDPFEHAYERLRMLRMFLEADWKA